MTIDLSPKSKFKSFGSFLKENVSYRSMRSALFSVFALSMIALAVRVFAPFISQRSFSIDVLFGQLIEVFWIFLFFLLLTYISRIISIYFLAWKFDVCISEGIIYLKNKKRSYSFHDFDKIVLFSDGKMFFKFSSLKNQDQGYVYKIQKEEWSYIVDMIQKDHKNLDKLVYVSIDKNSDSGLKSISLMQSLELVGKSQG